MAVRKTESHLPAGITAADLGQSAVAGGTTIPGSVTLVSFQSAPIAVRRTQTYVVFVTDPNIAASTDDYRWTFTGAANPLITEAGIAEFTPQGPGDLTVTVTLRKTGGGTLVAASLTQKVIPRSAELELVIDQVESNAPTAAEPETSRELVNDLRAYVNLMLPGPADELYNRTLSALAYVRCLETPNAESAVRFRRHLLLERIAAVLNKGPHKDFLSAAREGFGVCRLRPQVLAMFLNKPAGSGTYIPFAELPADARKHDQVRKAIAKDFDALSEEDKIDLFNRLRFPKSHFAMTRLVLDALLAKYFASGGTAAQVLKEAPKAKALLGQFETGPLARLGRTPASDQVIKVRALPLWNVKVPAIAGTGAGGPVGPPGPVGKPEKAPDITFIAQDSPNDNGFLAQAMSYHVAHGLVTKTASSIEKVIEELAKPPLTPIKRLRIVSHFFSDPDKKSSAIFIPIFEGARTTKGTLVEFTGTEHFEYGRTDVDGLRAHLAQDLFPGLEAGALSSIKIQHDPSNLSRTAPLYVVLFNVLLKKNHPSLTPFGFKATGPTGEPLKVFKHAGDIFRLNNTTAMVEGLNPPVTPAPLHPSIVEAWKAFLRQQIDDLGTSSGLMAHPNVKALADAIIGLSKQDLPVGGNVAGFLGEPRVKAGGVFLQNHDTFRANLVKVRGRLHGGFVDVRGCSVGLDPNYLKALRTFIGVPAVLPTVSGPDWLQSFTPRSEFALVGENQVDQVFTKGIGFTNATDRITPADVQRAYSDWSGMIGLGAQLSFWSALFTSDAFALLDVTWRNKLPPIGMQATRLRDLASLSYPDLVNRLRELFFIPANVGPSGPQATGFAASVPHAATVRAEIDNVGELTQASPPTAIPARLGVIQAVASSLAQTLPPAPPPAATFQEKVDHLKACLAQLRTFLLTTSNITPLFDALKAKVADPKFGIRTMLASGLPLVVQQGADETTFGVCFMEAHRAEALRSLMRIHWAEPLPPAVATAIAQITPSGPRTLDNRRVPTNDTARALQLSLLTVDATDKGRTVSHATVNPEDEFASHIINEPGR